MFWPRVPPARPPPVAWEVLVLPLNTGSWLRPSARLPGAAVFRSSEVEAVTGVGVWKPLRIRLPVTTTSSTAAAVSVAAVS